MDYTSDPDGPPSNEHPNQHDYDQLVKIYGHLDSTATAGAAPTASAPGRSGQAGPNDPAEFGRAVGPRDGKGRSIVFERELPGGERVVTHVTWALEADGRH
jgi:hypothetical protein